MAKSSKIELYQEEQVLLSKERTILAFMQTGLAFVATGTAIVNIFKDIPAHIIGYILIGIGFVEVFESMRRLIIKQREMEKLKKKLKSIT
jgi:uncharacterized membrane protein YidH (DUF202 family)